MNDYQEEQKQEFEYETRNMVTTPRELTILLGHVWPKEKKGITPDAIFPFPISFPIAMVKSFATLDAFYMHLAAHWVEQSEHERQAAALMGGAEQWEQLRNDPSVTVRMAVAWAAAKPIQLKLVNDPDPTVREYLARFGDDDVRQLLLDNELQQPAPNHEVLIEIAKCTETAPMMEHTVKSLWEQPEHLSTMLRAMPAISRETLALLAVHNTEGIRVFAARRASEEGYPEVVQTVFSGELSQFSREIVEELLEESGAEKAAEEPELPQSNSYRRTGRFLRPRPVVTILESEHKELAAGQRMTLFEADALFQKLDSQAKDALNAAENNEAPFKRVSFRIEFSLNREFLVYEGQQDLGDGDGSLLDHIRDYQEFCATSAEWASHVIQTKGTGIWQGEYAEHRFVLDQLLPALEQYRNSVAQRAGTSKADELFEFAERMYWFTMSTLPENMPAGQSRDESIAGLVQHIKNGQAQAVCAPLEKVMQIGAPEQQEKAIQLLNLYQTKAELWAAERPMVTAANRSVPQAAVAL